MLKRHMLNIAVIFALITIPVYASAYTVFEAELVGSEVVVTGWVHRRRDHGGVVFVDLRDRYGITQCVFRPENESLFAEAEKLPEAQFARWKLVRANLGNKLQGNLYVKVDENKCRLRIDDLSDELKRDIIARSYYTNTAAMAP